MTSYRQVYDPHITCDWCGTQTRGRVYDDRQDVVVCGLCHRELKKTDEEKEKRLPRA